MKSIAFFNNKGGVGKTSLVYHLAWMYAELGLRVLAADLDPQANLTSMFLKPEQLETFWPDGEHPQSILGSIDPIRRGLGDIAPAYVQTVAERIGLIVGDLGLSLFEDKLSTAWPLCLDQDESAFRILSAFYRILLYATQAVEADITLLDVGPNLGAINRAAVLAAQFVAVPLAPDLFSLQGLRNLGPTLRVWRKGWEERLSRTPDTSLPLPARGMEPIGYIILQHAMRLDRPVKAYGHWMERIPGEYRRAILEEEGPSPAPQSDPHCLYTLKHYRSLMPMAMEAGKPMFFLRPADGAIGAHVAAVLTCYQDFKHLAENIAGRTGLRLP